MFAGLAGASVDASFATFGEAATFQLAGVGALIPVTVIPTTRDVIVQGFDTSMVMAETLFELRASEVAKPVKESQLVYGGVTYRVASFRRKDARGLVWLLGCEKVS